MAKHAQLYITIIWILERLRQKDHEFQTNLTYIMKSFQEEMRRGKKRREEARHDKNEMKRERKCFAIQILWEEN